MTTPYRKYGPPRRYAAGLDEALKAIPKDDKRFEIAPYDSIIVDHRGPTPDEAARAAGAWKRHRETGGLSDLYSERQRRVMERGSRTSGADLALDVAGSVGAPAFGSVVARGAPVLMGAMRTALRTMPTAKWATPLYGTYAANMAGGWLGGKAAEKELEGVSDLAAHDAFAEQMLEKAREAREVKRMADQMPSGRRKKTMEKRHRKLVDEYDRYRERYKNP